MSASTQSTAAHHAAEQFADAAVPRDVPAPEEVPAAERILTVLDPRDASQVGVLAAATVETVAQAVARARAAQPEWAATGAETRGRLIRSVADRLLAAAGELAELNSRETGRPLEEAHAGIEAGVHTLEQYAELGPLQQGRSLRGAATAADYTRPEPRGVVAALTPWNDPVAVAAGLLGAALVTGNAVLHKPSERCPHLGERLGEVFSAVLPDGVFTTITGGAQVGSMLTAQPDIDVFAHVGSTATGKRIAQAAALTGAHTILENGGNDPLLIDADVDPVWAAEQAAIGAFSNSGQICTAVERIYVHRSIADAFQNALVEQARERNEHQPLAPLVDTRLRSAVHEQVQAAVELGAHLAVGGKIPAGAGAHYPATVLLNCTPEMAIMNEETFGPVAPVQVVEDFEEGLQRAAAGRYGLAATVLTGSIASAHQAIDSLSVGTVKINDVFGGAPGGAADPRRDSGHGFGYGPELLDEFTQVKVVHVGVLPAPGKNS